MEAQKVLNTDLLDIIFEGRNKQYGAYLLRKDYQNNVRKALVVGALAVLSSMAAPLIYSKIMSNINLSKPTENVVNVKFTDMNISDPVPLPPSPPPKKVPPPQQATIKYMPPVVKPDGQVQKEEPPVPPTGQTQAATETQDASSPTIGVPTTTEIPKEAPPVEVPKEDTEVYQVVEQQAEFPGGTTELMKYLRDNIKFPAIARENGIQGRVVLKFVVEKDGSVNGITVLKSIHELLDKEAIRVVKSMPSWKAGKQGGRNVRSYFTLPVSFKLEG
jgi:periplasmic protein TonB